jgi:hypothetical protein
MPVLVAGIHVLLCSATKDVDGPDKPGHDVERAVELSLRRLALGLDQLAVDQALGDPLIRNAKVATGWTL